MGTEAQIRFAEKYGEREAQLACIYVPRDGTLVVPHVQALCEHVRVVNGMRVGASYGIEVVNGLGRAVMPLMASLQRDELEPTFFHYQEEQRFDVAILIETETDPISGIPARITWRPDPTHYTDERAAEIMTQCGEPA